MSNDLRAAVLAYDAAIKACANEPEKMASFCTAQGDNLDMLYDRMLTAAREERIDTAELVLRMQRALEGGWAKNPGWKDVATLFNDAITVLSVPQRLGAMCSRGGYCKFDPPCVRCRLDTGEAPSPCPTCGGDGKLTDKPGTFKPCHTCAGCGKVVPFGNRLIRASYPSHGTRGGPEGDGP